MLGKMEFINQIDIQSPLCQYSHSQSRRKMRHFKLFLPTLGNVPHDLVPVVFHAPEIFFRHQRRSLFAGKKRSDHSIEGITPSFLEIVWALKRPIVLKTPKDCESRDIFDLNSLSGKTLHL